MFRSCIALLLLLPLLAACSDYKFRCWWMCQDQTAIQHDYIAQRDHCRSYAQLKLDMAMRSAGERNRSQSRNARLISLFSDCMAKNGWSTTERKSASPVSPLATPGTAALGNPTTSRPAPPPRPQVTTPVTPIKKAPDKITAAERAAISRKAECAFARQAASASKLAATRAKACDLECTQRLRMAPDAPRPAACPTETTPGLETGAQRAY